MVYRSHLYLFCIFLAEEDEPVDGEMILARRHTIANAARRVTIASGSSSARSSVSPPPSDVTPSASQSDINSEEILSDVMSDHDNKVSYSL